MNMSQVYERFDLEPASWAALVAQLVKSIYPECRVSWVQIPPEATHFSFFHLPQMPVFLFFHLMLSCIYTCTFIEFYTHTLYNISPTKHNRTCDIKPGPGRGLLQ